MEQDDEQDGYTPEPVKRGEAPIRSDDVRVSWHPLPVVRWDRVVLLRLRILSTVLAAALAALAPPAVDAQERSGLWGGLGAGYGAAEASSDEIGAGDREGSGVGYLAIGWTLTDQVLLGGEAHIWSKTAHSDDFGGNMTVNLYSALVTLMLYPSATGRFFVKGGLGASALDLEVKVLNTRLTADLGTGVGYLVGAGYDIPAGPISITPALSYWGGNIGDLEFQGETLFTHWKQNVVAVTIGITFH
jgi:hypothetical protein